MNFRIKIHAKIIKFKVFLVILKDNYSLALNPNER